MIFETEDYIGFFEEEEKNRYIRRLEEENSALRIRIQGLLHVKQDAVKAQFENRIKELEAANGALSNEIARLISEKEKERLFPDASFNSMNRDVKIIAKERGVRLWQVAEELGISEQSLSRMLRRELSPEEKAEVLAAISKIQGSECL